MSSFNLIRTISGKQVLPPDVLYIDPNNTQFVDDVVYSVHLEINDDDLGKLEYNTIYEETLAPDNEGPVFLPGDGTSADLKGEHLYQIAVTLFQKPDATYIIKPNKTKIDTTQTWKLPDEYDPDNIYFYEWEIVETPPSPVPAVIESGQNSKAVQIRILQRGLMYLKCNIYREIEPGVLGCPQVPRVVQEIGLDLDKFVISRNRFTQK